MPVAITICHKENVSHCVNKSKMSALFAHWWRCRSYPLSLACTSAPCCSNSWTVFTRLYPAARCNGVDWDDNQTVDTQWGRCGGTFTANDSLKYREQAESWPFVHRWRDSWRWAASAESSASPRYRSCQDTSITSLEQVWPIIFVFSGYSWRNSFN